MRELSSLLLLLAFGVACLADPWCVPGWNATCNNRGTCNPTSNTCECNKIPFRCKNETRSRNAFDFNNRCATLIHGCFYELTPGGDVSQHLCNNRGCCKSESKVGESGVGYKCLCFPGYTGKDCEKKDPCYLSGESKILQRNCSNQGTCQPSDDNSTVCSCNFGHWGSECEFTDLCKVDENQKPREVGEPCAFDEECRNQSTIVDNKPMDTFTCSFNELMARDSLQDIVDLDPRQDNVDLDPRKVNVDPDPRHPCWEKFHPAMPPRWRNCSNHGLCERTPPSSSNRYEYTCRCRDGYFSNDCKYTDLCKIDDTGKLRASGQPYKKFNQPECHHNQVGSCCEFINPCTVTPCQHNGTCNFTQSGTDAPVQTCVCSSGYTGDLCESRNLCTVLDTFGGVNRKPRDCNKRGNCSLTKDGMDFVCACKHGFFGKECDFANLCIVDEKDEPRPPNLPCVGFGACRNHSSGFPWWPNDDYNCTYPDPCLTTPCQNGADCSSTQPDPHKPPIQICVCQLGFIGTRCEDLSKCYIRPNPSLFVTVNRECNQRGNCETTEGNKDYFCNCASGYWGKDCNFTNLCIREPGNGTKPLRPMNLPCHGGTCKNTSAVENGVINDTFNCSCPPELLGEFCQFPNPCTPTPCQNGGSCKINQTDPNTPPTRNCVCKDGYNGINCQVTNPCYVPAPSGGDNNLIPRDCNKRGECSVLPDGSGFNCTCASNGYWGKECEFIDLCKVDMNGTARPPGQPCNTGTCHNTSIIVDGNVEDTFKCNCPKESLGEFCQFPNPCYTMPCLNGATCILNETVAPPIRTCQCEKGYIDDNCGVVNPCYMEAHNTSDLIPRDCNKRGECIITGKLPDVSYSCNCTTGYWYRDCAYIDLCKIDENGAPRPPNQPCYGDICRNHSYGSVFLPTTNSFTCECYCNRTGEFCQYPNPCRPNPCKNGGNCTFSQTDPNKPPIRNCTCKDGYVGSSCEIINPCYVPTETGSMVPRDCNGRGECMVTENGTSFECKCSNGYFGKQCNFTNLCKVNGSGTARPPNQPCNGGVCRNNSFVEDGKVNNTFTCSSCPNGRLGRRCEFINPCTGMPCKNGGTCKTNHTDIDKPPTKNCTCPDAYIGENCHIVSPCFYPSPSGELVKHKCNGRGECNVTEHQNGYKCVCKFGYWGKECEFIDLCKIDADGNMRAPDKPCNGGTCKNQSCWLQSRPELAPVLMGFGDRCEQINPCYFNATYCKNSATCVREGNYTFSCNCTKPYFQGVRCEDVNLCKAPPECEIFNGGMKYCNPCKNGGKCESNFTDPTNVIYKCNCSESDYGGDFCDYMKGKLIIIPEDYEGLPTSKHVDRFTATSGYPHNYYIIALVLGEGPTVDFFTGDGFSFRLQKSAFQPVDRKILALSGIISPDAQYFAFRYTYGSCPGFCKMSGILKNFATISSVAETLIDIALPPGLLCVPNTGLRNVGHVVNDAPEYKRTSRFVVEANLKFECYEENWLNPKLDPGVRLSFKWTLYRLSTFFPTPSAWNDMHIEMLTATNEKYLVFEPHVLLEGFYWVECRAIVKIGQQEYGNSQLSFFRIVINPPRIELKESTTRYVDGDQEIIIDASESVDDSFPEHTPHLDYIWTCETPCDEGPWEGPVLQIPAKTFQAEEIIKIRLKVSSNHARTFATEVITLHIGSGTKMAVQCVRNCDYFNPGDEVLFECVYEINGVRQPAKDIALAWLPPKELIPEFNVDDDPYVTSVMLPIVNDPSPRAIICSAENGVVSAKMEFRINMPPMLPPGGSCFITPFANPRERGVYLVTRFKIECNTKFIDPHMPLRYSFYAQSEDKELSGLLGDRILLNYDTNPKTEDVFLPLGNWNRNPFASWRMKIILKVTDNLGLSTELSGYTFVEPPDTTLFTYPKLFENLIFGEKSLMRRRFLTGDNQGVLQLQTVAVYGVHRPAIMNSLTIEEQHKFLSSMEHTLIRSPFHSLKLMEQKITAAHFIDHIEERPEPEVLTEVSQILFESASQVLEYTKQREEVTSPKQIEELARAAADSASRLLKASYKLGSASTTVQSNFQMVNKRDVFDHHTDDEVGRDYFFEVHDIEDDFAEEGFDEISETVVNADVMKYAKVSHHTLLAFERAMDAALEHRGYQTEFDMSTDEVGLHARILPEVISDQILDAKSKGTKTEIVIPEELHDIFKERVKNDLELQITEVVQNPFYDDSSADPHTPVVNLVLKDSESHVPVLLENLPYPLNITLPIKPPSANALNGARTAHEVDILPVANINEDTELLIFKLDLPYDTTVDIEIDETSSSTMIFKIIVLRDHRPTLTAMCSYPLLEVVSLRPRTYLASFSTETLELNETPTESYLDYYVGIFVLDPNNIGSKQRFRILFTRNACLHRDEDRKFWSEEGCIVD
ncbi:Neurogenic locus notch protein 1, partial [Orchesella cincta]